MNKPSIPSESNIMVLFWRSGYKIMSVVLKCLQLDVPTISPSWLHTSLNQVFPHCSVSNYNLLPNIISFVQERLCKPFLHDNCSKRTNVNINTPDTRTVIVGLGCMKKNNNKKITALDIKLAAWSEASVYFHNLFQINQIFFLFQW